MTISPLDIYFLTRALELHGVNLEDVSLVYLRGMDTLEGLRTGRIDAAASYPPNSSQIEAAGIARPIFDSRRLPGEIMDVLAFDEVVNRERPDDVAAVIRAFYRAVRFSEEHPEEAWRIMAERERVPPETFRAAMQTGIRLVPLSEQQRLLGEQSTLPATVQRISEILHEHGQLTKAGYDTSLLNGLPAARAASSR